MSPEQLITDHLDLWTSAVTYKSGRGAGKGRELTGIKKLRELILELAVRGKLVEQDPNDQPASVLLEKIADEKARLGKGNTSKSLPKIKDEEVPFDLPPRWEWCRLEKIAEVIRGVTYKKHDVSNQISKDHIAIFRSNNIQEKIDDHEVLYISKELAKKSQIICKGDILTAMSSGSANLVGKAAQAEHDFDATFGAFCGVIRPNHTCISSYLGMYTSTPVYRNQAQTAGKGIGINNLNKKALDLMLTPIPPLNEQHRIVAKVDELMVLCDRLEQQTGNQLDAHEVLVDTLLEALTRAENADEGAAQWARLAEHFDTLFTTEASIDKLKQTILQLAVMGRLVEQDPNDEPASVLLEKIAEEKARLVEEGQLKRSKNLPPISDSEKSYALPKSWQWTYFQSTGYTRLGKMLDNAKNSGEEKKYLRNTNVQWWSFNLSDIKKLLLEEHELAEYSVKDGDLLICEGGEPGRCAVWQNVEREIYIQKAIHRHRTMKGVNPHFLKICLTVSASNGQLSKLFTGATIKHLPGDKLAKYICPFPPVAEQHRIVSKVDELITLCDQLKARISDASETRTHLAETVVAQAVE